METQTEKPIINNSICYERLTEFETLLNDVKTRLEGMYSDDFEGLETLENEVEKSINTIWQMRRNYDVKKLLTFKK